MSHNSNSLGIEKKSLKGWKTLAYENVAVGFKLFTELHIRWVLFPTLCFDWWRVVSNKILSNLIFTEPYILLDTCAFSEGKGVGGVYSCSGVFGRSIWGTWSPHSSRPSFTPIVVLEQGKDDAQCMYIYSPHIGWISSNGLTANDNVGWFFKTSTDIFDTYLNHF